MERAFFGPPRTGLELQTGNITICQHLTRTLRAPFVQEARGESPRRPTRGSTCASREAAPSWPSHSPPADWCWRSRPGEANTAGSRSPASRPNRRLISFMADDPGRSAGGQGHRARGGRHARRYRLPACHRWAVRRHHLRRRASLYLIDPATGAAAGWARRLRHRRRRQHRLQPDGGPPPRGEQRRGTNLRVNPNNGALAATDGRLAYSATDPACRRRRRRGAASPTQQRQRTRAGHHAHDRRPRPAPVRPRCRARPSLVTQAPPNDGVLNTVGALPVRHRTRRTQASTSTRGPPVMQPVPP